MGSADASRAVNGLVARDGLFERLGASARVTMVSAPAGSGKTVLLRSWIGETGLAERAAWLPVGRDDRDPRLFWPSVLDALRGTTPGSELVRALTTAPNLDGWVIVERLLKDLAPLRSPLWLVIDDLHELDPATEVFRQLELLIMRAPRDLRFVLATRHDLRLGLHRLRLEGELTEIRADDLRFTLAEAGALMAGAGVSLPEPALVMLHERTEGWAAGLRLAALSLAGRADPTRFAAEFSGSERTVAEYLLAEVLERQSDDVRRLLLRTSVLDRLNGELADLLTGAVGGERILQDLERANAFVVSVNTERTWFRYHQLFADLLRLELRRTAPDDVAGLHRTAAEWLAGHGHPMDAARHALAARDWRLAIRLLADHWPVLRLGGQSSALHAILARFPAGMAEADAELAVVVAADEQARGSLEAAERYLGVAERGAESAPADRRVNLRYLVGIVRLLVARQRGDMTVVAEAARHVQAMADALDASRAGLGEGIRAMVLINLGIAEYWTAGFADAGQHLAQGQALARRLGYPYLEFMSLAYRSGVAVFAESFTQAAEHAGQAIEVARRHGWTEEPAAGIACMVLGSLAVWQGRLEEAEPWVQRSESTLRAEAQPAAGMAVHYVRGLLELARDRNDEALAAFQTAERVARRLAAPNLLVTALRGFELQTLVRLGETGRAERMLAGVGDTERERGEIRISAAVLWLAQGDPRAVSDELAPVLDGSAPLIWPTWRAQAYLLEAIARDEIGEPGAADEALERALDVAELNGTVLWFLLHPAPGLFERHARHRTTHASLIVDIRSLLAGGGPAPPAAGPRPPREPLSESELRVLRYLPTNLTAPEIAGELSVSLNTVKTHIRNLYAKLGTHSRTDAVTQARALGLLAPSTRLR